MERSEEADGASREEIDVRKKKQKACRNTQGKGNREKGMKKKEHEKKIKRTLVQFCVLLSLM